MIEFGLPQRLSTTVAYYSELPPIVANARIIPVREQDQEQN